MRNDIERFYCHYQKTMQILCVHVGPFGHRKPCRVCRGLGPGSALFMYDYTREVIKAADMYENIPFDKKEAFLAAICATGDAEQAAQDAGVPLKDIMLVKYRDSKFSEQCDEAYRNYLYVMGGVAARRARDGSDSVLKDLMKMAFPDRSREKDNDKAVHAVDIIKTLDEAEDRLERFEQQERAEAEAGGSRKDDTYE